MTDRVTCTMDGGVADVRLNRPDKLNALDLAMFDALVEVGESIQADPSVRAVVLSGEGRGFCAGLDFTMFEAMADKAGPAGVGRLGAPAASGSAGPRSTVAAHGQWAVWVWASMPAPVIAAVHGPALGGGLQLAVGADIRIVAPDSRLSVLEIRWGLAPDMTATQLLPRLVGTDVAKELTFTGRMVSGEEAVKMGLATRLSDVPRDDALALAAEIAAKNPQAIRNAKALLDMAGTVTLQEGFAAEQRSIRQLIGSPNQVEAVTAYFEKRDATFGD